MMPIATVSDLFVWIVVYAKVWVLERLFSSKLPFVFSEIDGTICEGFANGNGSYSMVLAVSKGCGGRSIFTTPFET
jgi:hypothetical protein